ncbi:MAG: glycoside hydrolase family 6 protein [Gemmatimonadetes bacterium]|nr:glycoside hydrolase family 6 protein [Gemmatimonadota bacterium]
MSPRLSGRLRALVGAAALLMLPVAGCQDSPLHPGTSPQSDHLPATLEIWWPTEGASVSGTTKFQARLPDWDLSKYQMYWEVDGGRWNWMSDSQVEGPHKEAVVDVSSWNWRGAGPYAVTFIVRNKRRHVLAKRSVTIYVGTRPAVASVTVSPASVSVEVGQTAQLTAAVRDASGNTLADRSVTWSSSDASLATVSATGVVTGVAAGAATVRATAEGQSGSASITVRTVVDSTPSTNPFANVSFYRDPYSRARKTADQWYAAGRTADAEQMEKLAQTAQADWFGDWNSDIYQAVYSRASTILLANALPVFILYNIPGRDCNGYSAGGSSTVDAYRTWIDRVAAGVGDALAASTGPTRAVLLLEPDALPGMDCLPALDQENRIQLIREATQRLKQVPGVSVYLDAGHPQWKSASVMADRLARAGLDSADGFSLNVSNYTYDADNITYGERVSSLVGGKHFIVDSSRNGLGPTPDDEWCNPYGRGLGRQSTAATGHALVDAFFWLKKPGESDGSCNGGPSAGSWWAESNNPDQNHALGLARRAPWALTGEVASVAGG